MKNVTKNILLLFVSITLFYSCEKEVSRSPIEAPPPTDANILVESSPSGAEIFVNGRATGQYTPDSLTWLDEGGYNISLKIENFFDTTVSVFAVKGTTKKVFVDYWLSPRVYGKIQVTSKPSGVRLFLDGSVTGAVTPFTFYGLIPKKYTVRGEYEEHRHAVDSVVVKSNTTQRINLTLVDTSLWVSYDVLNSDLPNDFITALEIEDSGTKWIGTSEGITRYDDVEFVTFNTGNSNLPNNSINCIEIGPDGRVWIGTLFGLAIYDNGVIENVTFNFPGVNIGVISDIKFHQDGRVWVGTEFGLLILDNGEWELIDRNNSRISDSFVSAIGFNAFGAAWLGTTSYGINYFDGVGYTVYHKYNVEDLPGNGISSIDVDQDDIPYFAHTQNTFRGDRGGLTKYVNGEFIEISLVRHSVEIRDIWVDRNNDKWISTGNGLELIKGGTNRQYAYTDLYVGEYEGIITSQLNTMDINVARLGNNNDLWFGTNGRGITKLKQRKINK